MIRIGNILINPFDISSIHEELKLTTDVKFRGTQIIQIIYKNGVVKNFTAQEIGMSYLDFIEYFMKECEKQNIWFINTIINSMDTISTKPKILFLRTS